MSRTALKLNNGESVNLECMFDSPLESNSKFGGGKQWAYAVKDLKSNTEHTVYANEKLHAIIQGFNIKRGSRFTLSKKAGTNDSGQPYSYFEVTFNGKSVDTVGGATMSGRPSPDFGETNHSTYRTNTVTPDFIDEAELNKALADEECCKDQRIAYSDETDRMFKIWKVVCKKNDELPAEWRMSPPELQKMAVTLFIKG